MNTETIIIIIAFALVLVALLGGCLALCKSGEEEGICKYDNDKDGENNVE